jgi:hypothetical protein
LWSQVPAEIESRGLIVANYSCDASHTEWTEQVVSVLDEGDCYYRVRHDLEAVTFTDLEVTDSPWLGDADPSLLSWRGRN